MNNLKNKVSLMGRLGVMPEFTKFDNGSQKTRFTLATSSAYKDKKGTWVEQTEWHTIIMWGKLAEKAAHELSKGQEIVLEGKITYQTFETKAGEKRTATIIEAQDFLIVERKVTEKKAS